MYILSGSRQMELQASITQSLAGRNDVVDLQPLSIEELAETGVSLSRDEAMFQGGLPRFPSDKRRRLLPPNEMMCLLLL